MSEEFNFYVLEGLDGSGKTSVVDLLKTECPNFLYTREPGGSPFGEAIRRVLLNDVACDTPPKAMLLGFMSARSSHLDELVIPALKEGKTVVSDRCDGSSFAFQVYGNEDDELHRLFWDLRKSIFGELKVHYIYLRLEPCVAEKRRKQRRESTHFDSQTKNYHQRVFEGYEKFFEILSETTSGVRCSVVDASQTLEEVYENVFSIITGQE